MTNTIPTALQQTAALYNLTIKYDTEFRRYFVNDTNTVASLLQYAPWEFNDLDAEQLESDIDEAIENYQHKPLELPEGRGRNRSLATGRFRKMEKIQ